MPTPNQTITGIPSGYVPQEYPKAAYARDGKTVQAKNPAHMEELAKLGYTDKYVALKTALTGAALGPGGLNGPLATDQSTEVAALKQTVATLTREVTDGLQKFNNLNVKYVDAIAEIEKFKTPSVTSKPPAPAPAPATAPAVPPVGKQAIKQ